MAGQGFSGGGTFAAVMVAELEENPVGWKKPSEGEEDLAQENKWKAQPVCGTCFTAKSKSGACGCW